MKQIFTILFFVLASSALAQKLSTSYTYSTGTGTALLPLTGAATVIVASNVDDTKSQAFQPAAGSIFFNGTEYNSVVVSPNGYITLEDLSSTNAPLDGPLVISKDVPHIAPLLADGHTRSGNVRMEILPGVSTKLVVEWNVAIPYDELVVNSQFQLVYDYGDSSFTFIYGTVAPTLDNSGNPMGAIGMIEDNTNRVNIDVTNNTQFDTLLPSQAFAPVSGRFYKWVPNVVNIKSGRVGINTTAPTAALDVKGNIRIRNSAMAQGRVLTSDNNGNATWQPLPAATPVLSGFLNQTLYYNGSEYEPTSAIESNSTSVDINGDLRISSSMPGNGKVLTSDALGNATWQTPFSLPSATTNQTLRYNGSAWVPSSSVMLTNPGVQLNAPLQITGAGAALGRVLTSDATGNATWELPAKDTTSFFAYMSNLPTYDTLQVTNAPYIIKKYASTWNYTQSGSFNPTTGEFTASKSGVYQFSASLSCTGGTNNATQFLFTLLHKTSGGATIVDYWNEADLQAGKRQNFSFTQLVKMNVGEKVMLQILHNASTPISILCKPSAGGLNVKSYFCGHKIN